MSIDSSVDDYWKDYLGYDVPRASFYEKLYSALLTLDTAILQAVLAEDAKPIDLNFLWAVPSHDGYRLCERLVRAPECVRLLLPRATYILKSELLDLALAVQGESGRLIIESGIKIDSESLTMQKLSRRQDLFALHIALYKDSGDLHKLARTALCSSEIPADCLLLIIQKGFDVREIFASDYKTHLWVVRWSGYSGIGSAQQQQMFTNCIEPKLALVVLAGACSATDLSRNSLSETLVQWQQIAPHHFCPSQDGIVAYLKAQATGLVRRFGADVCIALQGLDLPALIVCEILQAHCAQWPLIPFHCYWNLAVAVKHFLTPTTQENKRRRV